MKGWKKKAVSCAISGILCMTISLPVLAFKETQGVVTGTNVSVRSEASVSSARVSSVTNGVRMDVVDETTDSSGTKWYKVRIDATRTGFIRSDLISLGESSTAATTATTTSNTSENTSTSNASANTDSANQTATVKSERINVRREASTAAEAIGALGRGSRIYVTGQVTGSDGNKWYQVKYSTGGVEKIGFVRADLLNMGDTAASTATTSSTTATTAASAATTKETTDAATTTQTVKALTEQAAYVSSNTINVRSAAGTGNSTVGGLKKNASLRVNGETVAADGSKWYRIVFSTEGGEKTGFVRSDLIKIGTPPTTQETASTTTTTTTAPAQTQQTTQPAQTQQTSETPSENAEQPAPEATEAAPDATAPEATTEQPADGTNPGDEYSLVKTAGTDGVEAWYLYDNVNRNRAKVEDLTNAARSMGEFAELKDTNKALKLALIVLGIFAALLLVAAIFMFMKMRELLYYDDEPEPDPYPARHSEKRAEKHTTDRAEHRDRPSRDADSKMDVIRKREERRQRGGADRLSDEGRKKEPANKEGHRKDAERVRPNRPERGSAPSSKGNAQKPAKPQSEHKAKNFAGDDDFDFEFLDLDDDLRD